MELGSLSHLSTQYPKNLSTEACGGRIKVYINNDGEIVTIEKEQNGFWTSDAKLKTLFERLPKILNTNKKAIITIIQ